MSSLQTVRLQSAWKTIVLKGRVFYEDCESVEQRDFGYHDIHRLPAPKRLRGRLINGMKTPNTWEVRTASGKLKMNRTIGGRRWGRPRDGVTRS
jgi:hypothetical protein